MSTVSHWFFNVSLGETEDDSKERIVLIGGYGGCLDSQDCFDGYYCRGDIWSSEDGAMTWKQLAESTKFGGRAWMGVAVQHDSDPRFDLPVNNTRTGQPPKIFLFGGGFIGSRKGDKKIVSTMQGKADGYYSRDGITWHKINYEEGGGE